MSTSPSWRDRALSAAASVRYRVRALLMRRQLDRDLRDELAHHLAARADLERERGLSDADAARRARVRFGSVGRIRDDARDAGRFVTLADLAGDVRHGARLLGRDMVFTTIAIAILSVGIGAGVTIFGAMHALIARPIPGVAAPEEVVAIGRTENHAGFDTESYPNAIELRARNTALADLAMYADLTVNVDSPGRTARLRAHLVSAAFFDVIGSPMSEGRAFSTDDARVASPVAIVSDEFRRRWEGAAPIIGATIRVNRAPVHVIGVAPPEFRGLTAGGGVDLWLPLETRAAIDPSRSSSADLFTNRDAHWLWLVGRLKPGTSIAQSRVSMDALAAQLAAERGDASGRGFGVEPIGGLGPTARAGVTSQWALMNGLSALVLLVICFNVGSMTLARTAARAHEMALRLSLGASRRRLVRQVLAEHVSLAIAGGIGGACVAWWASSAIQSTVPSTLLAFPEGSFAPDWRAFALTAILALASCLVFSIPPALAAGRARALGSLRAGIGARVSSRGRSRQVFAVLQVALSLSLLIGGALLARSLQKAARVDLGFEPAGVVTAYYDLSGAGYTPADGARMHARIIEQLGRWSAVESAALGAHAPLQGASLGLPITIAHDGREPDASQLVRMNAITPMFFSALRTPMLRGRAFSREDDGAAPRVAIVNETCAARCFGGGNPIGRRIVLFDETSPREIVGVVADSKYSQPLEEIRPTVFVPAAQRYSARMAILLRTASPAAVLRSLPDQIRAVDSNLPLYDTFILRERFDLALWPSRTISALAGGFGLLTLVLAVLGVYALVAHSVQQSAPDLAVRMALGAEPSAIQRLIVGRGLRLVAAGMAAGVGLALGTAGILQPWLFGIQPLDPISFGAAMFLLSTTALVACLIPGMRAAAASPAAVLRRR
jgi:predicted permease